MTTSSPIFSNGEELRANQTKNIVLVAILLIIGIVFAGGFYFGQVWYPAHHYADFDDPANAYGVWYFVNDPSSSSKPTVAIVPFSPYLHVAFYGEVGTGGHVIWIAIPKNLSSWEQLKNPSSSFKLMCNSYIDCYLQVRNTYETKT